MLAGLVDELRSVGIAVSVGEHLDAAQALSTVSLQDKEVVRAALQCALIKNARAARGVQPDLRPLHRGDAQRPARSWSPR